MDIICTKGAVIALHRVIYVDSLIFLNTVVTYILLLSGRAFGPVKTGNGRLIAASSVGGISSLILLAPQMASALTVVLIPLLCAVIVLIAFYVGSARQYLLCFTDFFGLTLCYGGIMFFLSYLTNGFVQSRNGIFYVGVNFWGILFVITVSYYTIVLIRRIVRKKSDPFIYRIELSHNGNTAKGKALFDSGHKVTDCYTGRPVVIAGESLFRRLLGEDMTRQLLSFGDPAQTDYGSEIKIRYIPVQTVSGHQLLPAFTCSKISVFNDASFHSVKAVSLALSENLKDSGGYEAIINQQLLEEMS